MKMKLNELMIGDLMIGDWVNCNGANVKIISIGLFAQVGIMDSSNDIYSVFSKDLVPIPLTAEILQKNEFVKSKYGEMILDKEIGTSEIYLVLEPSYDEAYYYWTVNSELIAKIESVHKLQHVLRLCGIDKNIEL